jgi:hypothetical protein
LKSIMLQSAAAASGSVYVVLLATGMTQGVEIEVPTIAAGTSSVWSGWTVLNATDQLAFNCTVQPIIYWVAGAVLPFA